METQTIMLRRTLNFYLDQIGSACKHIQQVVAASYIANKQMPMRFNPSASLSESATADEVSGSEEISSNLLGVRIRLELVQGLLTLFRWYINKPRSWQRNLTG